MWIHRSRTSLMPCWVVKRSIPSPFAVRPRSSIGPPAEGERAGLLRVPEDLVDLPDQVEQLLTLVGILRPLGVAGCLAGLPEELVQLRVLLGVLRLEVVRPQHPQVVLHQVGALLLDEEAPGPVVVGALRVPLLPGGILVLLLDGLDRLGLDACLRGIVDAARQVAVGVGHAAGPEQALDECSHGKPPSSPAPNIPTRTRATLMACGSAGVWLSAWPRPRPPGPRPGGAGGFRSPGAGGAWGP